MNLKLIAFAILTLISKIDDGAATPEIPPEKYPNPHSGKEVDSYHDDSGSGDELVKILDPYEWMENPCKNTEDFVKEENALTEEYFAENSMYADAIKACYAELWKLEKFDGPIPKGDNYFSYRSTDADKQEILYVHDEPIADGREFLDPNKLSPDSSVTLIKASSTFSPDGKVFAYLTYDSKTKSHFIQFKHLETGKYNEKLIDVENNKVLWMQNDRILYMTYFDDGDAVSAMGLYYHELETEPTSDVLLREFKEGDLNDKISFEITEDRKYLIRYSHKVYKIAVGISEFSSSSNLSLEKLIRPQCGENPEFKLEFVTNIDSKFIFHTNCDDASNYKLVSTNFPNFDKWEDVVQENPSMVLDWAKTVGETYIVLAYISEKITTELRLFDVRRNELKTFQFPSDGAVKAESIYFDEKNSEIYLKYESFFTPYNIFRVNVNNLQSDPKSVRTITVPNFNPSDYEVKYEKVPINDGNDYIPTHIVHKRNMPLDGENLTFMTASGGFGVKNLPYFSINRIVVVRNLNGVHVIPHIPGGGEKGEQWHLDGSVHNKQNSMNGFKAVAEFLQKEKYTSPKFLAIDGGEGSISGPLIGASINQNPGLFGVAIAEAGLMDMFRFDDLRPNWIYEYGSPFNSKDFHYLREYSPLHNTSIDENEYPATMIISAIDDERVPSFHSLKFIATLQNEAKKNSEQKNPLIFLEAKNKKKTTLEEAVLITRFIVINTGVTFIPSEHFVSRKKFISNL